MNEAENAERGKWLNSYCFDEPALVALDVVFNRESDGEPIIGAWDLQSHVTVSIPPLFPLAQGIAGVIRF